MWFDRYGARHTVASLSLLAVAGALWIAAPGDGRPDRPLARQRYCVACLR
jgi:hypothetical protein